MDDSSESPLEVCKRLIFSSATEKEPSRRQELSHELSVFLTKPGGLMNLLSSVIDFDASSQKLTTHNQRFLAIATIITRLPRICIPYKDYCANLAQQMKSILLSQNSTYQSLATIIVKAMLDSPHSTGAEVVDVVIRPIMSGLNSVQSSYKPSESIVIIHSFAVNRMPSEHLIGVFPRLFYALAHLYQSPSGLKGLLRTTLICIMNSLKPGAACCLLEKTLFHDRSIAQYLSQLVEDEEISIKVLEEPTEGESSPGDDILKSLVLSLIEECNDEQLTLEFFFHFQECMWNRDDGSVRHFSAILLEPLLDDTVEEKSSKLDLSSIIVTNQLQCLNLVHRTLLNYLLKLKHPEDGLVKKVDEKLEVQSIRTCINILEVLKSLAQETEDLLEKKCIPVVKELKHELETKYPGNEAVAELKAAIECIESSALSSSAPSQRQPGTEDEISGIVGELNDKLVPVRVHALIRLKQLAMSNDEETVSRIPQLFNVIAAFLEDEEPYVFLACIGVMAEMALRRTQCIMPKLIELHGRPDLELQVRMNIGEVLVRLLRQLNDTAPMYAQQVLYALIEGCADPEELMRMSSLTNVGELCRNLRDSLGKYMIDILSVIERVMADDTVQVKTAAIDLLRTALTGLNKFTAESIQDDLKCIYSLLKRARSSTLDENLCLQADLALDEMDRVARELLGCDENKKLVKNIRVLSLDD